MLICAMVIPAFCQKDQEPEPDSWQARELKACGAKDKEVNYAADTDETKHPTGEPTAGKALIYILRPSRMKSGVQTKLAVDGEWKGVNRGRNYFFFTLEPGLHYFCSQAKNRSVLVLTVEADKTYYIEQEMRFSMRKPRNDLAVIGDADAKTYLANSYPSTWTVVP
jgi:hypothetical protein